MYQFLKEKQLQSLTFTTNPKNISPSKPQCILPSDIHLLKIFYELSLKPWSRCKRGKNLTTKQTLEFSNP